MAHRSGSTSRTLIQSPNAWPTSTAVVRWFLTCNALTVGMNLHIIGTAWARGFSAVHCNWDLFPSRNGFLIFADLVRRKRGAIQIITFRACFRWRPKPSPHHSTMCISPPEEVVTTMLLIQHNNHATVMDSYAEPVAPVSPRVPGRILELSCGVLGQATVSVLQSR